MVHQQLPRRNRNHLQRRITDEAVDTRRGIEQLWILHRAARNLPLGLYGRNGPSIRNNQCYCIVQLSEQKPPLRIQIPYLYRAVLSDSLLDIGGHHLLLAGHPVPYREHWWHG